MIDSSEMGINLKGLESIHLDGYDLVINHIQNEVGDNALRDLSKEVMKMVSDGEIKPGQFGDWPQYRNIGRGRYFIDREKDPSYFAKQKWVNRKDGGFASAVKRDRSEKHDINKSTWLAGNSVQSEMRMSCEVAKLLNSKEILDILADIKIDKVKLIEPLMAIIDRGSYEKYMIYPFVMGSQAYEDSRVLASSLFVVSELKKYFKRNGIYPDDLSGQQLLIDRKTNILYITDIEFYIKLPSKEFKESVF